MILIIQILDDTQIISLSVSINFSLCHLPVQCNTKNLLHWINLCCKKIITSVFCKQEFNYIQCQILYLNIIHNGWRMWFNIIHIRKKLTQKNILSSFVIFLISIIIIYFIGVSYEKRDSS